MILLARHGETADNRDRRFQGQGGVPLNARGREQAATLAAAAQGRGIVRLVASPLPRARETADVVGAALGLAVEEDARFIEADTGDWSGRLFDDVEREDPEGYAAYHATDPDFRFPGGESLLELQERVIAGLVDVTQRAQLPALVVAHRGVVRVARAHTHRDGLRTFMGWDVPNGELMAL